MKGRLLILLTSISFMFSCNSEKQMLNTYKQEKTRLVSLASNCESFFAKYQFKEVVVRYNSAVKQIRFAATMNSPHKYFGCEFSATGYEALQVNFSDSLEKGEKDLFAKIPTDSALQVILRDYMVSKIEAVNISNSGVFLSLGSSIKSKNPEMSAGILMTSNENYVKSNVIKEIEKGVLLYETVIE